MGTQTRTFADETLSGILADLAADAPTDGHGGPQPPRQMAGDHHGAKRVNLDALADAIVAADPTDVGHLRAIGAQMRRLAESEGLHGEARDLARRSAERLRRAAEPGADADQALAVAGETVARIRVMA